MIRIVRGNGFPSVGDLCRILEVKERTLFNDFRELKEELGVELQFDKSKRGYFLAVDNAELNFFTLSEDSAFLLLAALGVLKSYGGEDFAEPLKSAFHEGISFCLGNGANRQQVMEIIKHESNMKIDKILFIELCRACLNYEPLRISFESGQVNGAAAGRGRPKKKQSCTVEKEIVPHHLIFTPRGWKLAYTDGPSGKADQEINIMQIKNLEFSGNGSRVARCALSGADPN